MDRTMQLVGISEEEKAILTTLADNQSLTINEIGDKALITSINRGIPNHDITQINQSKNCKPTVLWFNSSALTQFTELCSRNCISLENGIINSIRQYISYTYN